VPVTVVVASTGTSEPNVAEKKVCQIAGSQASSAVPLVAQDPPADVVHVHHGEVCRGGGGQV
jgi:hypothetical protein